MLRGLNGCNGARLAARGFALAAREPPAIGAKSESAEGMAGDRKVEGPGG